MWLVESTLRLSIAGRRRKERQAALESLVGLSQSIDGISVAAKHRKRACENEICVARKKLV